MACLLQTSSGDLDLSTGNFQIVTDVNVETGQKLSNLFSFGKGEWYPDRRQGVPFQEVFLVKNPNLAAIQQTCRNVCKFAPGVGKVNSVTTTVTAKTRNMDVTLSATTLAGAVLQGGPGKAFVVTEQPA